MVKMVMLRLTKMEVQELRLWAYTHQKMLEDCGMKFESDQIRLKEKLDKAVE